MKNKLFNLLLILATLPVLTTPMMISQAESGYEFKKYFIFFYPVYNIVAAFLAWTCRRYHRHAVAWILLILMILTDITMWQLVKM
ncbi:MAG: hypothetical protein K2O00_03275 [Muribaculaceae bacterium]|nr:hypothetical protein [Muribaculaceae bacterium]